MQGEAGEAGNVVKKLRRIETGMLSARAGGARAELLQKLADEIGDVYAYLDLLAQFYGLDIEDCIRDKFNAVSVREGMPERIGEQETGDFRPYLSGALADHVVLKAAARRRAEHITEVTGVEDPDGIGLATAEWRCSCGAGSPDPIAPPTAERKRREHLADVGSEAPDA